MMNLLGFEWRYHTRQLTYLAAAGLITGMAFVLVTTGFGPSNLFINSAYSVMYSYGMLSLVTIFVVTVLSAGALLRDIEHRMSEIIFATPVGRWSYVLSRFGGVVLATFATFLLATLVLMLAPLVLSDAEVVGPVHLSYYGWALLTMALPNIIIATAIVFAIAAATRSTLATWVGGVLVYALYFITAMLVDSPLMAGTSPPTAEALARAAILDPFGLSAFFEQTRYWAPAERNTRLLALSDNFLLNRLLWLSVAGVIIVATVRFFSMRLRTGSQGPRMAAEEGSSPSVPWQPVASLLPAGRTPWRAIASATRLDVRYALASRPAIALMLLWVFFIGVEAWSNTTSEYRSQLYPTTALMLDTIATPLMVLGSLALVFFAAELAWRARANSMDELLDATPAPSAVTYLGHFAALALLVVATTVVSIVVGITVQLLRGYHDLQLPVYLSLFWTAAVPLLLLVVLMLFLNALSPNRYVGMLLSLAAVVILRNGSIAGIQHPLAIYGSAPSVTWSDMSGFSSTATSYAWFTLYWGLAAALLALVTVAAWRRGREGSLRRRIAAIPRRMGRRGIAVACVLVLLTAATGGFLWYQGNVRQRYMTREATARWRAQYERAWRSRIVAAPEVTAIRSDIAMYPSQRRFSASGSYRLENRGNAAIDTVWITVRREARSLVMTLDGAPPVVSDTNYGMYGFVPTLPLASGDTAHFTFSLEVVQPRIRAAGFDESIAANGSFLLNTRIFPQPGYNRGYQENDPVTRRQLSLPEVAPVDTTSPPSWISFEATVSTDADQVAVAPGTLEREWEEGGRHYFSYANPSMINWFAIGSARYAMKRVEHDGVAIEVYYHPAHGANVGRMIAAATTSLDLFGGEFGPYPLPALRIVEVPSTWQMGAAVAFPGIIFFVEDRGFLTDARDSTLLDLVTRRVAHEVAHQWWGMQLSPAPGPGATMLVESFAKYGEQRVLAATHGEPMVEELMLYDGDRYLAGRTGVESSEPPLIQAGGDPWLYYGKGGVVMNAIRALVGQEALDRSMRRLLEEQGGPEGRATTADFMTILREEVSPEYHAQLDEWLGEVVLYDLSVPAATAVALPGGRYLVTVELKAARLRGDSTLALDEAVDVAVYGDADSVIALEQPVISGRDTTLTLTVGARPVRAAIDPFVRRLDRERSDNERKIMMGGRGETGP